MLQGLAIWFFKQNFGNLAFPPVSGFNKKRNHGFSTLEDLLSVCQNNFPAFQAISKILQVLAVRNTYYVNKINDY